MGQSSNVERGKDYPSLLFVSSQHTHEQVPAVATFAGGHGEQLHLKTSIANQAQPGVAGQEAGGVEVVFDGDAVALCAA